MDVDQQEIAALERKVGDQATSPLFAKLAHLYLESGRAKDALRICDAGLANYPFYSTAHLIKGKALLHLGMNGEARREFEFVRSWLPTNPTASDMLGSVPVSDDQILEAPAPDDAFASPDAGAATVESEPTATSEAPAPEVPQAEEHAADDSGNMFGLPSEAPVEGVTEASGQEPSDQGMTDGDAFAQFGASDEAEPHDAGIEADFGAYAARKQQELGASGGMSLEEYLDSAPVSAPSAAREEPAGSEEDPFAATGFGTAASGDGGTDTDSQEVTSSGEEEPPVFGGFGEQPEEGAGEGEAHESGESPALEGFGETPEESPEATDQPTEEVGRESEGSPAFEGFGEQPEGPPETTDQPVEQENPETAEPPVFGGFGGEDQPAADDAVEEPNVGEADSERSTEVHTGSDQSGFEEESRSEGGAESETSGQDSNIFAGFAGPEDDEGEGTPRAGDGEEPAAEEASAFPDFSGIPVAEGSDTFAEDDTPPTDAVADEPGGFEGPPPEDPAPPTQGGNRIEELTEKLQDAKKITPVIDLTNQITSSSPSSADEAAVDAGFVTPTLAEIYAKQGWFDDAINAYKTLAKTRPAEKEKFEERVKELQEEKAQAG